MHSISAQVETSEPEALVILDNILKDYENAIGHKIAFSVDYEVPGNQTEQLEGTLVQKGNKYNLEMSDQQFICNGETVWLYLKNQAEIQINDYEPNESDDEIVSPADIFSLHRSGRYIFALANSYIEKGMNVTEIEGKPVDKDSDYSKVRLTISSEENRIISLKIFNKDASRITMNILIHDSGFKTNSDTFNFDTSSHPDVIVEDLRF